MLPVEAAALVSDALASYEEPELVHGFQCRT